MELSHVMSDSTIDETPDVRKGLCEVLTLFPRTQTEMRERKRPGSAGRTPWSLRFEHGRVRQGGVVEARYG
jgi:hypothetical protein